MKRRSAAGTARGDRPGRRQRRGGYRNTRADASTGARWGNVAAFRGGKQSRIHPVRLLGGCPVLACLFDVDSAHSLRQATSAGRNLITVFFTVNTPAQNFFAAPVRRRGQPGRARHRQRHPMHAPRRRAKQAHEGKPLFFGCAPHAPKHTRGTTPPPRCCRETVKAGVRPDLERLENFCADAAAFGIAPVELRKLLRRPLTRRVCRRAPATTACGHRDAPAEDLRCAPRSHRDRGAGTRTGAPGDQKKRPLARPFPSNLPWFVKDQ